MKISIIGSRGYPYVYSGYETFVKELSERLAIKNIDVFIYCHSRLFKKRKKSINGINLIYTPSVSSKFFSQIFNSFFSILHACFSNTDVILVVNVANGPFGLLTKLFGKKTIINVDGIEWERPKWKGIGSVYFKISAYFATKFYDQIVTDSEEMRKIYLQKFDKESCVIAYGHNKNFNDKSNILRKFTLKKNDFYLVIGRMVPDNNADIILNQFLKSNSTKKLVIVGDVPYNDKYSRRLKSIHNHRVIFTGYINSENELADLYKNCFAYIHGHEFGGTNPTMINAIFYNSRIFALKNLFSIEMLQNINNKFFFNKNDDSLKFLFQKKFKSINEIRSINKKYDWDNITNEYCKQFYKLMLSKN